MITASLDAQATIGVAFAAIGDIKLPLDVDAGVVLAHPGIDVLDIKGHRFAEARDLLLEGSHRGLQKGLQQLIIEAMQLLAQPIFRGDGLLDIKAIGLRWVQVQAKA